MTTWTTEQIQQARGIRAKTLIDPALATPAVADLLPAVLAKMFRGMDEIAHTFGLDLDSRDIQFREQPADDGIRVEVLTWWEPDVRVVELRGGQPDGQILQYARAPHDPLNVVIRGTIDWSAPPDAPIAPEPTWYSCTGWDEQHRRWIYTPH